MEAATSSDTAIEEIDHGPFGLVPEEAFERGDSICYSVRSMCTLFYFSWFLPHLYVVIYPVTLTALIRLFRLKAEHPILFEWRQFYPGLPLSALKRKAKRNRLLRRLLAMRLATFRSVFLLIWPGLWIGFILLTGGLEFLLMMLFGY